MKTKIITKIQKEMMMFLNQEQNAKLSKVLLNNFKNIEIIEINNEFNENHRRDNIKILILF